MDSAIAIYIPTQITKSKMAINNKIAIPPNIPRKTFLIDLNIIKVLNEQYEYLMLDGIHALLEFGFVTDDNQQNHDPKLIHK